MRLERPAGPLERPPDLAAGLRAASARYGHRPALSVLRSDRREEQGFASLAQWAAKGAHLLEIDVMLEAGDELALAAPAGWSAAAVCLAAWWAGVTVVFDVAADVTVAHEDATPADGGTVFRLGDALDGSPVRDVPGEPWAVAVQAFPDVPPRPRASPDTVAVITSSVRWTHADLLAAVPAASGPLGVAADAPPEVWLPAVVRPLLTGQPTSIVHGDRAVAEREGVTDWAS